MKNVKFFDQAVLPSLGRALKLPRRIRLSRELSLGCLPEASRPYIHFAVLGWWALSDEGKRDQHYVRLNRTLKATMCRVGNPDMQKIYEKWSKVRRGEESESMVWGCGPRPLVEASQTYQKSNLNACSKGRSVHQHNFISSTQNVSSSGSPPASSNQPLELRALEEATPSEVKLDMASSI
jgi:hypothetical protein